MNLSGWAGPREDETVVTTDDDGPGDEGSINDRREDDEPAKDGPATTILSAITGVIPSNPSTDNSGLFLKILCNDKESIALDFKTGLD